MGLLKSFKQATYLAARKRRLKRVARIRSLEARLEDSTISDRTRRVFKREIEREKRMLEKEGLGLTLAGLDEMKERGEAADADIIEFAKKRHL